MKTLAWLGAAVAVGSWLIAASPLLYGLIFVPEGDDFWTAGWALVFLTMPAAVPGYLVAALLGIIACALAIKRDAKKLGVAGIIALVSPPVIAIASAFLDSSLSSWCELILPIGLVLAFLVFVAGLITTIVAAHRAKPRQTTAATPAA
ncbi:MAG: hypothetical protein ACKOKC_10730 [Chthoniobacterales bacterium]